VTGAGRGVGRTIAERLAAEGAEVVVADLDERAAEETVWRIQRAGGRARARVVDLRVADDIHRLLAEQDFGPAGLRILVNNAGGIEPDWERTLDLNLRAPMLATHLAIEPMQRAGRGLVVNIASAAGLGLQPYEEPAYAAAKAGLIRFTAAIGGRLDVRINCVVADWVETDRARLGLAAMTEAERAALPPPVSADALADAVMWFVQSDRQAGRVLVLVPGEPARLLEPRDLL
jgi:NAD(P)-dependent dehydrogenase (short-subunit alcohol dehydrogenase family)